jgi:hypothetical protein
MRPTLDSSSDDRRLRHVGRAIRGRWRLALAPTLAALAACGSAQGKGGTSSHARASVVPRAAATPGAASTPCGGAGAETLARAEGLVATRIYANELSSAEVSADRSQVEHYRPLLNALARGDRAGVTAAVSSLVFSHTHVVRLRVSRGPVVLADIGGPYIIAPVSGTLRLAGRVLGRYVLSVQDDLGYVKLVSRFIGSPLVLREGSRAVPVAGTLTPGPSTIPDHGPLTYRHVSYQAFSFDARSFPNGRLRISLLVPVSGALARTSCAEITVAELGEVARRISRRFALSRASFSSYIRATRPLTGGLLYIRSGSRQLAGSPLPGPRRLPDRGTVDYRGKSYGVFSFTTGTAAGAVRIYQLVRP